MDHQTDTSASLTASARERDTTPTARTSLTRRLVHSLITRGVSGSFRITYWDGTSEQYGSGEPRFHVAIRHPSVVWRVLLAPDPALGEAYMSGAVEVDHLDRLLEALRMEPRRRPFPLGPPTWRFRGTSVSGQYREIPAHYDLSDDFFALWLDASRTYSCAYFRAEDDDLETAQAAKIDYVLQKADIQPGQTLLDLGSGWGALLLRAARAYGARAHGITLSRGQYEFMWQAIRAEGLEDRVSVDLLDYRQLAARGIAFDRVVSVGMLEHVGRRNQRVFMKALTRLLKPGGVCVLHSITRTREEEVAAWVQRYVFPGGGGIPAWPKIPAVASRYGLHLIDSESLRLHYALTITHWAERFEAALPEVRALGFDETFIRTWRLWLRGCIAGFRRGWLDLHQWVFTHGISNQLPLTRAHLYGESETHSPHHNEGAGRAPDR